MELILALGTGLFMLFTGAIFIIVTITLMLLGVVAIFSWIFK